METITENRIVFEKRYHNPKTIYEIKLKTVTQKMGITVCPFCGREVSFWVANNNCITYCGGCKAKFAPSYIDLNHQKFFARAGTPLKQ